MLCVNGALADIVGYVDIYARQIHCLYCLGLHPIDTLMCSMQISKGMAEDLWANADSCPLEEKAGIDGQLIPGTPEMPGTAGNLLPSLGLTCKGEAIGDAIHQATFHRALDDVQFSVG